jgi:hypothetical protein
MACNGIALPCFTVIVLSIEERIFLVEYVFRESNRYTDLVTDLTSPDFYLWGAAKSAVYRGRPRMFNELKTAITMYIRNVSQAGLQKVFENKIKRVQACIDARGHHFQHLLQVHSDFPNALYDTLTFGGRYETHLPSPKQICSGNFRINTLGRFYTNIRFLENPVGAEFYEEGWTDRQTDRHAEAKSCFSQFCERA